MKTFKAVAMAIMIGASTADYASAMTPLHRAAMGNEAKPT